MALMKHQTFPDNFASLFLFAGFVSQEQN